MSTFDDRESAFENMFAHDEEMKFKARARRDKMLGLWAAGLMGKTGDAAQAYAMEVVRSEFKIPRKKGVVQKLVDDLDGKADKATVKAKLKELKAKARAEVLSESEI